MTTEIYTLSLHDALPISFLAMEVTDKGIAMLEQYVAAVRDAVGLEIPLSMDHLRSEEHTSELQSLTNLVCRLLLEKKKIDAITHASVIDGTAVPERADHT